MNLYINNLSALYFYSMVETSLDDVSYPCGKTDVEHAVASMAALSGFDLSGYPFGSGRLHVLVESQSKRSSAKKLACHVRTAPLPRGSFRKLDDGLFIVSPEYCFYEMAHVLPFPKLVEFGYLLCGEYTVNPDAVDLNNRAKLSTKRKLGSFADRMSGGNKHATIDRAMKLIAENSASPRETKLSMLLSFPVRLGGYGFPLPVLNYRIDFTSEEQELFGRPYVVLDLYWPDYGFGIEYDGERSHSDALTLTRDRKKASELDYKGIKVYSVDKGQISNVRQVYALALKAARAMGLRIRKPTEKQWAAKKDLFNAIM